MSEQQSLYNLLNFDPGHQRARYDDKAVRAAIHREPEAARRKYNFRVGWKRVGLYPLSMACCLGASREVVDLIYRAHPEAVCDADDKYGNTTLHWACRFKAATDVLDLLVGGYPRALQETSRYGWTPLRVACAFDASPEVIRMLVERCPEALQLRGKGGRTALHLACENRAPAETIGVLVGGFPKALLLTDNEGRAPLHTACEYKASSEVVLSLIEAHPDAVRLADRNGNTPIHWACAKKAEFSILHAMLSIDASLAVCLNQSGEIPLALLWDSLMEQEMVATIRGMDAIVDHQDLHLQAAGLVFAREVASLQRRINLLLRASYFGTVADPPPPTAAGVPRKFRALHAVCGVRCPRTLLNLILFFHGDQAGERDEEGNTALGLAVRSLGGNDIRAQLYAKNLAASLLELCPQAAYVRDPQGRFPLHVALEGGMAWYDGAVQELVRAGPEVLLVRDYKTHLYPYQMAAVFVKDVNTQYELLRSEPHLVIKGTEEGKDLQHAGIMM